jgi:hypothetical protein
MTSESTRFLGQPNEIKPTRGPPEAFLASGGGTEGAAGVRDLLTHLLYRDWNLGVLQLSLINVKLA